MVYFSHCRHPVPFTAHISPNTDEFSVKPTNGELPAMNTQGSLICVSYRPLVYGKSHTAKVVIQVSQLLLFYTYTKVNVAYHIYTLVSLNHIIIVINVLLGQTDILYTCSHPTTLGVMTSLASPHHILPLGLDHPPTS